MALATVGAFCTGEYAEAVFVMLFYQVGELFQDYAVGKSRPVHRRPDGHPSGLPPIWKRRTASGSRWIRRRWRWATSSWSSPASGSPWTVRCWRAAPPWTPPPSPANPCPGTSVPGDDVISGCVNLTRAAAGAGDKALWGIHRVQNSGSGGEFQRARKPGSEHFITRFARYYTPCVVVMRRARSCPRSCWSVLPLSRISAGTSGRDLAPPGADLPGHLLPLRAGDLRPSELFRRHRRRLQAAAFWSRAATIWRRWPRRTSWSLTRPAP